jgi:ATP/maltotriose-dependent transcriptional regulator MalT/DNA-binding transcriptional ArsR family regulator
MPSANRAARASGPPRVASTQPAPTLVGRGPELATLANALSDADAGHGRTVFVVGESGIGKTHLVSTLADQAAWRGFTVAVGRAYPVERGVPYAVFSDALLPVLRGLEPSVLTLLSRGGTAELMQLFPALGTGTEGVSAARGDPAELKARLLWNFSQFLSRFAAKHPLLLVLENLQWADSASLEMLHFVARQISGDRVLLVGTHNDPDHRGSAALRATDHSLRSLGNAQRVRLGPLGVSSIIEILERRFEAEADRVRDFAERLHRWTGGNPFFIDETIKALVDGGQLQSTPGGWVGWDVEELRVPSTIRDAVLARLSDLSATSRPLADIAAVLGMRATHDELEAASGLDHDTLIASIDELRGAGVLTEREDAGDIIYDFTHPLLQETLYSELGLARTRTLHGTVAEALEGLYGARAMTHAGELAFHYSRGDPRRLAAKAVEYLRAAGRDASAKYANREAGDYLSAALSIAEQDAGAAPPELVADVARVRQRLGDYAGAVELWQRALDAARAAADDARVAGIERSIGLARYWSGAFDEALAHYGAATDAARRAGDRPLEARVLIATASCLQAVSRSAEARDEVERALAIATELGDDALLARVHRSLLLLYLWTGPAEKAREHGRRAIALAETSGQRAVAWSGHWALAVLAGLTGKADELRGHLGDAHRVADELRSPLFRLWTSEVEIEYAAGIGEWDRAVSLAERAIAMARALGQRTLLPRVLVWAGLLYFGRGDIERGKACVDEAWTLSAGSESDPVARDVFAVLPAHIGRAAYHLAMGHYAEAILVGEHGLKIADRSGYVVWALHRLIPIVAEASLWASDMERATELGQRLRNQSKALDQRLGLAWADACDALVELLSGNKERAVALLEGAIEGLEAIPYVPDAARVRRQLARALAETGDRDGAMRELRRAHEVFAHLGAERELDATREQLRQLGARPPSRSVTQGVAGLTGREVEIVRLVAARRSNKEIGAALGISARTASTHLSNIFSKLGVSSRGELADLAREAGLLGLSS